VKTFWWWARGAAIALPLGLSAVLLASCAVEGGQGYSTDVRVGLEYYDPWFGDFGEWGPGYRVAPPRRALPRREEDRRHSPPRGYRPPPGARPVPSIPSQPHPRGPLPPK
jgi:hypothetical protein